MNASGYEVDLDEGRERARKSREAQGLPMAVTDPLVLQRQRALLLAADGPRAEAA